jgi:hypothetical protein
MAGIYMASKVNIGLSLLFSAIGFSLVWPPSAKAGEAAPRLCLARVADVSTSVTGDGTAYDPHNPTKDEYALQRNGNADALQSPPVLEALKIAGTIGIVYIDFASYPELRIPFERVSTKNVASFSDKILALPRTLYGDTGIGDAIDMAREELVSNCPPQVPRIIDVSGDGQNNTGGNVELARDRAKSENIIINGLPIVNRERDVADKYRLSVITNPTGQIFPASEGFAGFEKAMEAKLVYELQVHSPVLPSLGTRLAGLLWTPH